MRKIILTLVGMLVFVTTSFSQELFDTYSYSASMGKEYEIKVKVLENGKYYIQIQMLSLDGLRDNVGFRLGEKELSQFLDDLSASKIQYSEWKKTAVENGVKDLSREIKTKRRWFDTYFISSNEMFISRSHWPKHVFIIKENDGEVNHRLIVSVGKQEATSNQFITTNGGVLVFSNEFEIDEFIEKLNPSDIKVFADDLIKKSQLFN